MQKTLKVKADVVDIPHQCEFSAMFRFSYERFCESYKEIDIYYLVGHYWPHVNSWLRQNAILCAKQEYEAHKAQYKTGQRKHKPVWGSKETRQQYLDEEINKKDYRNARLRPVVVQGEVAKKSNRLFDFSRLNENIITYKPFKGTKVEYKFIVGNNQKQEIQYLIDNIGKIPIQVLLKQGQICFTYQQAKKPVVNKISHRIAGIDLNPSAIGISIVDFENNQEILIKAECFKISNDTRTDDNKRNYETIAIAHEIIKLAIHYRCSELSLERLTMGAKDQGKGSSFNRLCNNEWNRVEFQWIIKKLCDEKGIKLNFVNCAYSSTIGNILHRNLPDPCAAAWEIARRGRYLYVKQLCMYPQVDFSKVAILNHWKKQGSDFTMCTSWVDLHNGLKNSGLKYRVALDDLKFSVRDWRCRKSGITNYSWFY